MKKRLWAGFFVLINRRVDMLSRATRVSKALQNIKRDYKGLPIMVQID